jgi:hypothetical protein
MEAWKGQYFEEYAAYLVVARPKTPRHLMTTTSV